MESRRCAPGGQEPIDEEERDDIAGLTFAQLTAKLIGSTGDFKKDLTAYLKVKEDSLVIHNLEWLGLLSDDPLPMQKGAPVDILTARMLEKMRYEEGERDMLILQHEFLAEYPAPSTPRQARDDAGSGQRRKEKVSSTMIDFGIPQGDTSMSRTVGLPAAIGVKLILQGKINLTGVHTPMVPGLYEPILEELE